MSKENIQLAFQTISMALLNLIVVNSVEFSEEEATEDVIKEREKIKITLIRANTMLNTSNFDKLKKNAKTLKGEFKGHSDFFKKELETKESRTFQDYVRVLDRISEILNIFIK